MNCPICAGNMLQFDTARVLGRYDVRYYACQDCGLVQTESPYWLDEAYAEPIARSDIGLVSRNLKMAHVVAAVISLFFRPQRQYLDFAGGTGMLVRLMRDRGFEFYWTDRFTKNQYALGFEADPARRYEIVTAFEVFEHLTDPAAGLSEMLQYSDHILFSTILLPVPRPPLEDWWYYTLDTGQHVSLYSRRALRELGSQFGLRLYTNRRGIHLLSRDPIFGPAFSLAALPPVAQMLSHFLQLGKKSLLEDDYLRLTGKRLRGR